MSQLGGAPLKLIFMLQWTTLARAKLLSFSAPSFQLTGTEEIVEKVKENLHIKRFFEIF